MDIKVANNQTAPKITEWILLKEYFSNYRAVFHVRELARKLNLNHRTVSLALEKLEKRQILTSKTVGRNKEFSLNLENPLTKHEIIGAEHFNCGMVMEKSAILRKIFEATYLSYNETPVAVFGSYAAGKQDKESDIDILIVNTPNSVKMVRKIEELGRTYNKKIQTFCTTAEKFEKGLAGGDSLILEVLKNHAFLNGSGYFVDVFWRYYYGK